MNIVYVCVGVTGAAYPPAVQAALPRLVHAAAPPGSVARENRRQCLRVSLILFCNFRSMSGVCLMLIKLINLIEGERKPYRILEENYGSILGT